MMSFLTPGKALVLALGILFALPQQSWAHGGGLDSDGCHRETATGGYHCHNNDENDDRKAAGSHNGEDDDDRRSAGAHDDEVDDDDRKAAGVAVGVLLALWLVWDLTCDDDRQALSALTFSSKIGPGGTGFSAEYNLDGLNRVGFGVQTDQVERVGAYSGVHWRLAF